MRNYLFLKKLYNFDYHYITKRFLPTTNPISSDYLTKLRDSYRLEEDNNVVVPVFKKALLYGDTVAIRDNVCDYSYLQLYTNSKRLSRQIANLCDSASSSTVAFFYSNDVLCTLTLWGCWMCGQVAMPLECTPNSPTLDLLKLSNTRLIIAPEKYSVLARKLAQKLDVPFLTLDHTFIKKETHPFNYNREIFIRDKMVVLEGTLTNDFYTCFDALLLTSDVSKPFKLKTTTLSHKNLYVQIKSVCNAWQMSTEDRVYQICPSNNISGYIIANMFPLNAGSTNQLYAPFDAPKSWSTILGINVPQKDRPNILMTEPYVYNCLINEYDKIFSKNSRMVEFIKVSCMRNFRLMISSFMPLPKYVADRWYEITGHQLIDVYYVTNNGMVLYNNSGSQETNNSKIVQTQQRSQQTTILPDVKLRLVSSNNEVLLETDGSRVHEFHNQPIHIGNLMISSTGFTQDYSLPITPPYIADDHTNDNTDDDDDFDVEKKVHFFNTGDIATYENGVFKIIGRNKSDLYNTVNRVENINILNSTLYLHPDIDFAKVENCGIVYAIKPNRRMSLKSLKYFYATILKEYCRATIFHLDTNNDNNNNVNINVGDDNLSSNPNIESKPE